MTGRVPLAVERAARRDLRALPSQYGNSALGRGYLLCARELDSGILTPRDTAALLREMRLAYLTLYELSPPKPAGDRVDELSARREARMTAAGE